MSSGRPLGTDGYVVSGGTQVTTEKTVTGIQESLTGIDTKSDAWGKVIPLGFGRVRVAGALVWASQFYRTTQDFDETVTTKDIYTAYGFSSAGDPGSGSIVTTPLAPEDMSRTKSQVTHNTQTDSFIDLCYSFGKEGDKRKKRYISKIRINNVIAYDNEANYIAPGLGFSVRYGYDESPPAALVSYPNGIYSYKGQTLVIFNRFPCSNYGDKIPDSIDVEFGCCLSDFECAGCGAHIELDRLVTRRSAAEDRIDPSEITWKPCHVIVMVVAITNDFNHDNDVVNQIVAEGARGLQSISFTRGSVLTVFRVVDEAFAAEYNNKPYQLVTPFSAGGANLVLGRVRVMQLAKAGVVDFGQGHTFQHSGGIDESYTIDTVNGPAMSFRDAFSFTGFHGEGVGNVSTSDPVVNAGSGARMWSHAVTVKKDASAPAGPAISSSGDYYTAINHVVVNYTPCPGET